MSKILLVDDEKDAIDMMKEFLSARDFSIVTALDGEEGLSQFEKEKPDVIICDIKMPKKDGFQFLKELRSSKDWVPVIMVTALAEPVNVLKGYSLEADYYLTKPINLEDVLKAIMIMLSLIPLRKK